MIRRAAGLALAGAGLILVALVFDASPLFVPGVAFALLGIAAPLAVWLSVRDSSVLRRLDVKRVVEGQPVEATIEVRRGVLPLPTVINDPLAAAPISLPGAGRSVVVRVVASFDRRGVRHLPPPSLTARDPLGLAHARRASREAGEDLLVLPRTEPVRWASESGPARAEHAAALARAEALAAVEVDGLRPYRAGTPASRIHWPAVARGAGLLERRLRPDGDTRPLVVLDLRGAVSEDQVDSAVRAAASLVLELARRGGCALLLGGERRAIEIDPDLSGWSTAHVRLAVVKAGPDAPAPVIRGVRLGAVFYVAVRPLGALPAAFLGAGGSMIVLPEGIGGAIGPRASFTVAGCRGVPVGQRGGGGSAPRTRGVRVAEAKR